MHNFPILAPFFEYNSNLCIVHFAGFDFGPIFECLGSSLTKCSDSQLKRFSVTGCRITDEQAAVLVKSLFRMRQLLEFNFYDNKIESMKLTCRALAKLLKKPSSELLRLDISNNAFPGRNDCGLDDDCLVSLSEGLRKNMALTHLNINGVSTITVIGWRALSASCSAKRLILGGCGISDDGVACLGDCLADNGELKYLSIGEVEAITSAGWRRFFTWTRTSFLKEMELYNCNIDDDGAHVIASALTENTSVKRIHLGNNPSITSAGWIAFFTVLLNGNHSIEEVDIDLESASNKQGIWNALSLALCDKSSIGRIHSSNHRLHKLRLYSSRGQSDVKLLLKMNENHDKAEVARQKILKYHFSGGNTNMNEFSRLPESLMPHALAWIGRRVYSWIGSKTHGYSVMYNVIQSSPTLVGNHNSELHAGVKKRKR